MIAQRQRVSALCGGSTGAFVSAGSGPQGVGTLAQSSGTAGLGGARGQCDLHTLGKEALG